MSAARRNFILVIWFLFTLSLIISMLVLAGYSIHAQVCHDEHCAICAMIHNPDGIMSSLKAIIFAMPFVAASLCFMQLSVTFTVLSKYTPFGKKTKLTL